MSHSKRKTPAAGITNACSDKLAKRWANRRDRRLNREILIARLDDAELLDRRATSDPWSVPKDGKRRFDAVECPDLVRK